MILDPLISSPQTFFAPKCYSPARHIPLGLPALKTSSKFLAIPRVLALPVNKAFRALERVRLLEGGRGSCSCLF